MRLYCAPRGQAHRIASIGNAEDFILAVGDIIMIIITILNKAYITPFGLALTNAWIKQDAGFMGSNIVRSTRIGIMAIARLD